ncbi:hypothetical protein SISNIDRAFT_486915 [Sistotremastrum niveocremeum HHB9708]|uniref:HNH nuclease domain-containing protein n=1 Tax=Sistotremastrum niveocremeum HHB9708 TaxID=1314777 RepID=A0A164T112_9AGAM|nr:hypothetical protein SISNIDRAFT_486915 [Sistotremastrum niveocremeum HHB9708]
MPATPVAPRKPSVHDSAEEDESEDEFDTRIDHYYERRNILFVDEQGSIIAGLEQRGSFLIWSVYRWLKMLYLLPEDGHWSIRCLPDGHGIAPTSDSTFPTGSFQIISKGWWHDEEVFEEVCRRDERCLITGWDIPNPRHEDEDDFFCTRLFPLMAPSRWADLEVQDLIPGIVDSAEQFAQLLQSPSNSFICSFMPCEIFNAYWFSIDVDDDYRIVQFIDCGRWDVPATGSGRLLVDSWSDDAVRPSDALLRAHFQQALLRWLHHDPTGHQEYLSATKLSFRIQDKEVTSGHLSPVLDYRTREISL